jgi:hypothetical protein
VIERMGFISYFLINQDIVRFARSRGFFHVGRGSGANSLVAYCLRITDVDPMELDLYFERFISTARKKPPDFDIDFSWKDRDEMYRYVFGKYNGGGRAGLTSMRRRSPPTPPSNGAAPCASWARPWGCPRRRSMRSAKATATTTARQPQRLPDAQRASWTRWRKP